MRYVVVLCVALSGCAPIYVQMFNTSTAAESQSPEQWVFTQDSVRVFYGFYAERGVMAFAVENLRSTPVYVDWKRSSCVVNGARMNYWTDEVVTKSQAVTSSASISATDLDWYWIRTGTISEEITSSSSVAQRPERIAFIRSCSKCCSTVFIVVMCRRSARRSKQSPSLVIPARYPFGIT